MDGRHRGTRLLSNAFASAYLVILEFLGVNQLTLASGGSQAEAGAAFLSSSDFDHRYLISSSFPTRFTCLADLRRGGGSFPPEKASFDCSCLGDRKIQASLQVTNRDPSICWNLKRQR